MIMSIDLISFDGKKVHIICDDGQVFDGFVSCYVYADENDNNKDSIIVDVFDGSTIEFYQEDIKSITIIK